MNIEKRKAKREKYENLAKKSILFKPFIFRKIYKYSKKIGKILLKEQ